MKFAGEWRLSYLSLCLSFFQLSHFYLSLAFLVNSFDISVNISRYYGIKKAVILSHVLLEEFTWQNISQSVSTGGQRRQTTVATALSSISITSTQKCKSGLHINLWCIRVCVFKSVQFVFNNAIWGKKYHNKYSAQELVRRPSVGWLSLFVSTRTLMTKRQILLCLQSYFNILSSSETY